MIPYQKQSIDEEDINAVVSTLKSEFITTGPKVKEFEESFTNLVDSKYAVAVSNGTAALHLACLAANLSEGDELITSPITFLACANSALYCNAKPVFSDIDEQGNLDISKIKENFSDKTKIIMPVHFGGAPLNIKQLKENFPHVKIIEDACHALGSKFENEKVGSCKHSDMTVFSFHPVKHITTGEGGMITTNNSELYSKLLKLRNHGIDAQKKSSEEPWTTPMHDLGFNYRITDFQSALGISQLKKLDNFVENARKLAQRYNEAFEKNLNVKILSEKQGQHNSYHLYQIFLRDKETRLNLYNYLRKNNILAQIHYQPIYLQPYYQKIGFQKGLCPMSEDFYDKVLSLPIYPDLKIEDQNFVISKIEEFFKK
jgi:UDP-4-amino-4,6-dideoxy-N-acetyl-beta-L-altrosamine transaminase